MTFTRMQLSQVLLSNWSFGFDGEKDHNPVQPALQAARVQESTRTALHCP